ncbi:hypothetical protein [Bifidobacterium parmae]|uniref:Phage head fiber protein n=1 Tax=Bifidobacterium parmae TaxID=361854 RepID=A0A2N5IZY6_9BIFI|nr:hypothetical protein [Bifidobacterium parmae]PLS27528.1 phage head fiber protein [Bifidobacterium parmae]
MDVTWTDTQHVPQGELVAPTLDLQYGDQGNDFELTHATPGLILTDGCYIGIEGTEHGGRIDGVKVDMQDGHADYTYTGRTWHGILAGKIIQPDNGQDRLTMNGDANAIIKTIVNRVGLASTFTVPATPSGITIGSYTFHRYCTAWDGLRMMLTGAGARLALTYTGDTCRLEAVNATTYEGTDSDQRIDFTAERAYTQINHLIGLGKGELKARAVTHWYASANGTISQTQSLTGDREITQTYELTTSEGADLSNKTRDKLKELWKQGTIDLTIPDDIDLHIDDKAKAYDTTTGVGVTSPIVRIVVKLANGITNTTYEAGSYDWPDEEA